MLVERLAVVAHPPHTPTRSSISSTSSSSSSTSTSITISGISSTTITSTPFLLLLVARFPRLEEGVELFANDAGLPPQPPQPVESVGVVVGRERAEPRIVGQGANLIN